MENFIKAKYRGIPAYYNPLTDELYGRNKFYDILVLINLYWDIKILLLEELPILIQEEKE